MTNHLLIIYHLLFFFYYIFILFYFFVFESYFYDLFLTLIVIFTFECVNSFKMKAFQVKTKKSHSFTFDLQSYALNVRQKQLLPFNFSIFLNLFFHFQVNKKTIKKKIQKKTKNQNQQLTMV